MTDPLAGLKQAYNNHIKSKKLKYVENNNNELENKFIDFYLSKYTHYEKIYVDEKYMRYVLKHNLQVMDLEYIHEKINIGIVTYINNIIILLMY